MEIHSAVHSLNLDNNFQTVISSQPKELKEAFENLCLEMTITHPVIKEYRNAIGGHVKEKSIQKAIKNISPDRSGFIEVDLERNQYHIKFASELCMAALFDSIPDDDQKKEAEELIGKLKKTLPFKAIDAVFTSYVKSRCL
jgi:hypothetical protein